MNRTIVFAIAVMVLCAAPTPAEVVCIELTALVEEVDDRHNLLEGEVYPGQTIVARYTYEAATPDSNASPGIGEYWHNYALFGMMIRAGGLVFETDPDNVSFLMEMIDNHGTSPTDNYIVRSNNNLPLGSGITVDRMGWRLDDSTCTAIDSDELPRDPPQLEDWESRYGLTFLGRDPGTPWHQYHVTAHVTSATELTCAPHPICIELQAEVVYVRDHYELLGGAIHEGQTISGHYIYDLVTTDDNPDNPAVGDYWHWSPPFGFWVEAGDLRFETDPADTRFLVEMIDDFGTPLHDAQVVRCYNNLPLSPDVTVDHVAWQIADTTTTAVDSDALLTAPPDLSVWQSTFGLTLEGCSVDEPWQTYFVRAHATHAYLCGASSVDLHSDRTRDLAEIEVTASPNPFSGSTTIRFTTPEAGPAVVEIFDVSGRRIRAMYPQCSQGTYRIEWDGTDELAERVRSGIYFYRVSAQGARCSRRVLLLH